MEQILLAYGISKGIVTAIRILNKNMKIMVRSPDDTDFFDIVAEVLRGDFLIFKNRNI